MRIRDLIGTGVVLLTTAVVSAPAAAAPPDRRVEPSGAALEAELAELFTDACGVPVTVDAEGRVTYKTFYAADGSVVRQQNTYA